MAKVFLLVLAVVCGAVAEVVNENALVQLDLTQAYPILSTKIMATSDEAFTSYTFLLPKELKVASIKFTDADSEQEIAYEKKTTLKATEYVLSFEAVTKKQIVVDYIETNSVVPRPKTLSEFKTIEGDYTSLICPMSMYLTKSCQVVVEHSTGIKVLSAQAHNTVGNNTAIGPIDDIEPMREERVQIHFAPKVHLKIESMTHIIDLPTVASNARVEDWFEGATNEGPFVEKFSRADFQKNIGNYPNAIGVFEMAFDARAEHFIYKDRSGNISTSEVMLHDENVTLMALPRYPLMSGWKTEFMIGHDIAANVIQKDGKVIVKLPQLKEAIAEKVIAKVYLPDGAKYTKCTGLGKVEVTERDAFMSFAKRAEVDVQFENVNLMEENLFVVEFEESVTAATGTLVVFSAYISVVLIAFFLFIEYSA
uniref:Dolichyl-diphosphooligosaccharide--protein glycosyltransferase subunit 1 n=1 Tax=Entamoeba invadens TaxID=33085 RepID=S0B8L9_ENTIV|nr:dolichyl-diphosphooligosaccharide--protein glycosyltransferase 67 kDa subunit precursor, putative [Entamoeba invadens]